jgi:putative transposase
VNRELTAVVERWQTGGLSREPVKYLFLDGVNFKMRLGGSTGQIPVLVAIGAALRG